MQQLQLDEFLRSLKQNIDMPHSLLLGAGASIESGVLLAPGVHSQFGSGKKQPI